MGILDWLGRKWAKELDFTKVDSVLKAEALAAERKLTHISDGLYHDMYAYPEIPAKALDFLSR